MWLRQVLRGPPCRRRSKVGRSRWSGRTNVSLMYLRFGGTRAQSELSGSVVERWRAEEQLLGGGVGRGSFAFWDAVFAGSCASERRCGSDPPQRICEGSRHFPKSPLRHAHPKERARESFANSRDSSTVAVRIFATWHRLWQENTKKGSSERTPSP
jgi:hypothetical protein